MKTQPILLDDRRVRAIPIHDNGEPPYPELLTEPVLGAQTRATARAAVR